MIGTFARQAPAAALLESHSVFHVRSIFPDQPCVEESSFDLTPTTPQAEAVCCLFERYLSVRPAVFRDRLSFLKKGDLELDWSAATGGVALASIYQHSAPASIGVMLSGAHPQTDATMLEVFREHVLAPLFGADFDYALVVDVRPLVVQVVFPGAPEWVPALQLLTASLASVYFRTLIQACRESGPGR